MNKRLQAEETHEAISASSASVKSATRVLSIFEYFERVQLPRTLSEISQDLDIPVSSMLQLLRSVQSMGYLNYDQRDKTYSPSVRLAALGQWIKDKLVVSSAVTQLIEHLAAATGESILLSIQNGLEVQHIRVIHTSQSLSYAPSVGTLRPLIRSAAGRILLSQQSDEVITKTIERINALKLDNGHVFDTRKIMTDMRKVRKAGYAFSSNIFVKGAAIIAVGLPRESVETAMAVGVAGPTSRVDEQAIPELLSQIQDAIHRYL